MTGRIGRRPRRRPERRAASSSARPPSTKACGEASSANATLTVDGITAAPGEAVVARDALEALGPNPTTDGARLSIALVEAARVEVRIHDVSGRLVRRIAPGLMPAGRRQLAWDGRDEDGQAARAGPYFVRLEAGGRLLGWRRLVVQR